MVYDYRDLLRRYIGHVMAHEMIIFLNDHDRPKEGYFTDAEWAELKRLAHEATERLASEHGY
jgi:hypothetical protein